ncbi:phosphatidylinositol 4-kinase gamma 4-like [Castanea sativa]|uniref:phosphatidylinositol 4-kinase gamma 4-like n=1 Tax=Castanea sativa TaxID=21020 RepID=UPI003F64F812
MSAAGVALSPIRKESMNSARHYRSGEGSILVYSTVVGSVIPMRVLESDSISSVKLRIQTCKGFVVKKQKLVYGGRELAKNDTLIKDYGVTAGDILH